MEVIQTEVLVVGGGTGGVAAAVQAARRGAQTVLVSEFAWLGGMLTTAGVTAPDGLELLAWQTGIWGAWLRALQKQQPEGLDHAWVSFFTYEPRVGAAIFADWVNALPNLRWIPSQTPLEVKQQGNSVTAVRFADYLIEAKITLDATELGDVLALAEIPYRWGWEWQSLWQEPSAPVHPSTLTQTYSAQAPTWVFVLQDFGTETAPEISTSAQTLDQFVGTWDGYGAEAFLNYGRLPGNRFMINWPQCGNDYGLQAERLISSDAERQAFLQEAYAHAQDYAAFLQQQLGCRYGLAADVFPKSPDSLGGGAYALQPYYRESRRLEGVVTVREQDILPISKGQVAALPLDASGQVSAIAIGNYANDHHYPGFRFPLHPKSIRWGGRWTGTPFALPYGCLIPATTEGLLVCEKNISVSHIANGATRLQPTVLGIGQAAGMAAALCIERNCQPRELPVRLLQEALLQDPDAPMAVVPLLNVLPDDPDWLEWQRYYLDHPEAYPMDGNAPQRDAKVHSSKLCHSNQYHSNQYHSNQYHSNQYHFNQNHSEQEFIGCFQRQAEQDYLITLTSSELAGKTVQLVTLHPQVNAQLQQYATGQTLRIIGRLNHSGNWLLAEMIEASH